MYTRRSDYYDLRTQTSASSRWGEDETSLTVSEARFKLYSSAPIDDPTKTIQGGVRRRLPPTGAQKITFPYTIKKDSMRPLIRMTRMQWILSTAIFITLVIIMAVAICLAKAQHANILKGEESQNRTRRAAETLERIHIYTSPVADACENMFSYSCDRLFLDTFVEEDIPEKLLQGESLKYNHKIVNSAIDSQLSSDEHMNHSLTKHFLREYFRGCERHFFMSNSNVKDAYNEQFKMEALKIVEKEIIHKGSFAETLTHAWKQGIKVLFTLSSHQHSGIHKRFLTSPDITSHVEISEMYDHENETMRGQRILNKLISNYMDYFSLKPKVREGVAELSKSVHKLLLDIAHSDRHCNFTDAMEKIPGTGSPDQSESLQNSKRHKYVIPQKTDNQDISERDLNLRGLFFHFLDLLERKYCLSVSMMDDLTYIRPMSYYKSISELYKQQINTEVWVHYIGVQSFAQLTHLLWNWEDHRGYDAVEKCIYSTPIFMEASYFSIYLTRLLVRSDLQKFNRNLQDRTEALEGILRSVMLRMKNSLHYVPNSEAKRIMEHFLTVALDSSQSEQGVFMYTPRKIHVLLTHWINDTDNNLQKYLLQPYLPQETFLQFYARLLKINIETHINLIVSYLYSLKPSIAPWFVNSVLICDTLHIPLGAIYPWLEEHTKALDSKPGFLFYIANQFVKTESMILLNTKTTKDMPLRIAFYNAFKDCLHENIDYFHLYPWALVNEDLKTYMHENELSAIYEKGVFISYLQTVCRYVPIKKRDSREELQIIPTEYFLFDSKVTKAFNCKPQQEMTHEKQKRCEHILKHWVEKIRDPIPSGSPFTSPCKVPILIMILEAFIKLVEQFI